MSSLLDVNVLIALAWPNHVHHAAARQWFAREHRRGWSTCPLTESGFVRVSSNHRMIPDARTPGEAALVLHLLRAQPGHTFLQDVVSLGADYALVAGSIAGSAHVTDLHLALLARASGHSLVTFDRGAAQVAGIVGAECELLSL